MRYGGELPSVSCRGWHSSTCLILQHFRRLWVWRSKIVAPQRDC